MFAPTYENPVYVIDPLTGETTAITVTINGEEGCRVPLDPDNTDYANLMRLQAAEAIVIEEPPQAAA